jgi:cell division protein FtsL
MTPPSAAAAAARTAPAVHPRRAPLAPARRPRRVSGPVPARRAEGPVAAVSTHPLFDRLLHGRAWIAIIAFALIGIVTMQLGLLKLNAGIGRALEHEAALQRENSALSVENSEVAAGDTVELQATHLGMQLIAPGTLQFLSAQGSGSETATIARAIAALNARASGVSSSSSATSAATESEASATSATSTSNESATPATTSTAAGETAESTSTSGAAAPSTSVSSTPAASAGAPAPSESGASAATPTAVPSGESGGASASPGK